MMCLRLILVPPVGSRGTMNATNANCYVCCHWVICMGIGACAWGLEHAVGMIAMTTVTLQQHDVSEFSIFEDNIWITLSVDSSRMASQPWQSPSGLDFMHPWGKYIEERLFCLESAGTLCIKACMATRWQQQQARNISASLSHVSHASYLFPFAFYFLLLIVRIVKRGSLVSGNAVQILTPENLLPTSVVQCIF